MRGLRLITFSPCTDTDKEVTFNENALVVKLVFVILMLVKYYLKFFLISSAVLQLMCFTF